MMKVLKAIWATIVWPFRKVGEVLVIGERFRHLESVITLTAEALRSEIKANTAVVDSVRTEMTSFRNEIRESVGRLADRVEKELPLEKRITALEAQLAQSKKR